MINLVVFFLIVSALLSSLMLVISKNKIYSILYLIYLYICVSLLFMYIGASVVGLFYFLVYIGAVAVLFLFSIMILNLKDVQLENDFSSVFGMLSLFFLISVQVLLFGGEWFFYESSYEYLFTTNELLRLLGIIIFKHYSFVLTLAGMILLVAMMGAIYLTNRKRGYFMKQQTYSLARTNNIYYVNVY